MNFFFIVKKKLSRLKRTNQFIWNDKLLTKNVGVRDWKNQKTTLKLVGLIDGDRWNWLMVLNVFRYCGGDHTRYHYENMYRMVVLYFVMLRICAAEQSTRYAGSGLLLMVFVCVCVVWDFTHHLLWCLECVGCGATSVWLPVHFFHMYIVC